jgi:hypothetical protein
MKKNKAEGIRKLTSKDGDVCLQEMKNGKGEGLAFSMNQAETVMYMQRYVNNSPVGATKNFNLRCQPPPHVIKLLKMLNKET